MPVSILADDERRTSECVILDQRLCQSDYALLTIMVMMIPMTATKGQEAVGTAEFS